MSNSEIRQRVQALCAARGVTGPMVAACCDYARRPALDRRRRAVPGDEWLTTQSENRGLERPLLDAVRARCMTPINRGGKR